MKRLWTAAALAIVCHITLFFVHVSRFADRTITLPRSTCVTVTMSYRRPAPAEQKEKPVSPRRKLQKKKKSRIRKPVKTYKKPPSKTPVVRPREPEPCPSEKPEDRREPDAPETRPPEKTPNEKSHGDNVSNMRVRREVVPLYRQNPPPEYPLAARRRGYQGTVVLNVLVNAEGRVENLWVADSSGYRLLDNAAVRAVKNWFFIPGKIGGKTVKMWVRIPVRFQLQ